MQTSDPKKAGNRQIKVIGKLLFNGKQSSVTFTITVYDPCITTILTPANIPNIRY